MPVVHILAAYIRLASIPWFPLKHLISSNRNIQQELYGPDAKFFHPFSRKTHIFQKILSLLHNLQAFGKHIHHPFPITMK